MALHMMKVDGDLELMGLSRQSHNLHVLPLEIVVGTPLRLSNCSWSDAAYATENPGEVEVFNHFQIARNSYRCQNDPNRIVRASNPYRNLYDISTHVVQSMSSPP
jgi:hypothetical protein